MQELNERIGDATQNVQRKGERCLMGDMDAAPIKTNRRIVDEGRDQRPERQTAAR